MKTLLLPLLLLIATPAVAFEVPGCGSATFVAKTDMLFEPGPTTINSNLLVTGAAGVVKMGAHNTINGTVTAKRIILGTKTFIETCTADSITGPGTCHSLAHRDRPQVPGSGGRLPGDRAEHA